MQRSGRTKYLFLKLLQQSSRRIILAPPERTSTLGLLQQELAEPLKGSISRSKVPPFSAVLRHAQSTTEGTMTGPVCEFRRIACNQSEGPGALAAALRCRSRHGFLVSLHCQRHLAGGFSWLSVMSCRLQTCAVLFACSVENCIC